MLSKRSLSALTLSERQALQWQRLRAGRCARCFQMSLRRTVEENSTEGNGQGAPFNAPQRGPTRQQRAAMVSREVQMLQRDRPSPAFDEPDPNTLRPPGASRTVDPEAVGRNVGGGRMGENDGASQEGPFAQGVAVNVRSDVDAGADTRAARSTGQPFTVEGPAERGGSGVESGLGESTGERLARPPPEEDEEDDDEDEEEDEGGEEDEDDVPDAWTEQQQQVTGPDHLFQPEPLSRNELLYERSGSTLAASNFEGVIENRLRAIAEPGQTANTTRSLPILAHRLMRGQLVRFESKEDKAAVLEIAKVIARRESRTFPKKKKSDEVQPPPKIYGFAPLPETVREAVVEKMVKGTYDEDGLLQGKERYRQPVLNGVARATMMNGTYLAGDGERLLTKVRSLLPAAATQQQQQQKGGQQSREQGR